MDEIQFTKELDALVPGWEYHIRKDNSPDTFITAFKDGMCYVIFTDEQGVVNVRGIYPPDFHTEGHSLPAIAINPRKSITDIALSIVGTFLPKYQGKFAELSADHRNSVGQRYTLAHKLEEASGGFIMVRNDERGFPTFSAHTSDTNVEGSVRSGNLVYLDLVVPGDVAKEILSLLSLLKGGTHGYESDSPGVDKSQTDAIDTTDSLAL